MARLPLGRFAMSRRLALVNSQLLVAGAGFGRGAAALGQGEDPEHANLAVQGQRNDAPDAHLLAGLVDALAVDADMAGVDQRLGEGAALHQPDAVEIAVDPHALRLSLASSAKAWDGCGAAVTARRPAAAPAPGVAGAGEADFGHQPGDAPLRRGQPRSRARHRPDRRRRPSGPCAHGWPAGRRGRCGAIRGRGGGRRARRRAGRPRRRASRRPAAGARHRLAGAHREQGGAPILRGGLEQRRNEDVERAEADAEPVERLAVGLLEMRDRAEHRLAREQPAGIGEHRRERTHARRARRVGRRRREVLERPQVAGDLRIEPLLRAGRASAARLCADRRSSARAVRSAGSSSERPGARRARTWPCQATASPPLVFGDQLERLVGRLDQRIARGGRARRRGGARRRRAAGACRRGAPTDRRGNRSRRGGRSARGRR